jgi:hypothetical protein
VLHAQEASQGYEVIGQNTHHFVQMNAFFEAAGWNAAIDSLTMKACPEGYEVFCRTRDAFMQLYQGAGGDVQAVIQLMRAADYREPLYRLAAATDTYQRQYQQQYPHLYRPSAGRVTPEPR